MVEKVIAASKPLVGLDIVLGICIIVAFLQH